MSLIVTGSTGFLGQHLMAHLRALGYDPYGVTRNAYDLRNPDHLTALFKHAGTPDIIFHLAANVGGIAYNLDNPASIFCDNVMMTTQLIHQAMLHGSGCKFVMVGTVCSYPAHNPIPTKESRLFEGYPEESNGAYGVAKLIALTQLQAYHKQHGLQFAYPILSNLYGPGDSFDDRKSHVIPALIRRFISNPPKIDIWGDGTPTRDFLYVRDAAEALARFIEIDYSEPVNIAGGIEISIATLVKLIAKITDYRGEIEFDASKPGGQLRRGYDTYKARDILKWQARTDLETGLKETVNWFKSL